MLLDLYHCEQVIWMLPGHMKLQVEHTLQCVIKHTQVMYHTGHRTCVNLSVPQHKHYVLIDTLYLTAQLTDLFKMLYYQSINCSKIYKNALFCKSKLSQHVFPLKNTKLNSKNVQFKDFPRMLSFQRLNIVRKIYFYSKIQSKSSEVFSKQISLKRFIISV